MNKCRLTLSIIVILIFVFFSACNNSNVDNKNTNCYSDLEEAISQSIINYYIGKYREGDYQTESHINLLIEQDEELITVYTMVLYGEYTFVGQNLQDISGCHGPAAITFSINNGYYSLIDFWDSDGKVYADSIRERFPESIWDQALDTQKFIEYQTKDAEEKALNYFKNIKEFN